MEMFIDILMNAGPIGLLAAYAIYSNHQSEKRIEELLKTSDEKQEQIRERWISVVKKAELERDQLREEISRKVEELIKILERIEANGK